MDSTLSSVFVLDLLKNELKRNLHVSPIVYLYLFSITAKSLTIIKTDCCSKILSIFDVFKF